MTLQTIIKQRYGSALDWEIEPGSSYVPEKGEACWYSIPVPPIIDAETGGIVQTFPDTVVCKVGDGINAFKDLPYVQAVAADVYAWAKQDEASFINWLNNLQFISYNQNKWTVKDYIDEILFNTELTISAEDFE